MKFVMSYSFGKDSVLALHRMMRAGHTPVALITTINTEQERSWFHGIPLELMEATAAALELPLLLSACTPKDYEQVMEDTLKKAKAMGAEACVFGDIDIAGHQQWNEQRCAAAGLGCELPLWGESREALVQEVLANGYKALVKLVDRKALPADFAGQLLTTELVEKIKATGSDACGENGEYHTFVYDGPLFKKAVPFTLRGLVDLGGHTAADIDIDVVVK